MRYEGLEVWRVPLIFRRPIGTAAGTHRVRPVLLVRVTAGGAEGWGECGALAEGTSVDPPLAEVRQALVDLGVDRLARAAGAREGELPPATVVGQLFDSTAVSRMVAATLEMAVMDLELRVTGMSLAARLGVPDEVEQVAAGAVVGIPVDRDLGTLEAEVAALVTRGFGRVRLKIEPGWDLGPVGALRQTFPALALQVDANGAYRLADADHLARLDAYGLTCLEQPLPAADLPGHAALAERLATPICLDETLTSPRRLADALRYRACGVACLKPARLGGLLAARRAQRDCLEAGVPAFVGGLFETGLARTANAALAGLPGFSLPGDLSDPDDYLVANPSPYRGPVAGQVALPTDPGVGPVPDPALLASLAPRAERFPVAR
ncbi:MAG TPA: enolase C-terminal domain-like protein [Acidimicrobiales bacterium]|jgi:O-succinylbenzoate synthase|nr:enolase C-terminal domain-like protein [Acidimicrobiales bacterium]